MKFPCLLFFFMMALNSAGAQNLPLKAVIEDEFNTLKAFALEPNSFLVIEEGDERSSRAYLGGRITININQVERLINQIEAKFSKYIVRLIIAHELAHQIQFRHYKNFNSELLKECQADIIAGFLLYQLAGKDYYDDLNGSKNMSVEDISDRLKEALVAIFELGEDFYIQHTHPKRNQRRTALRDGMIYGNIWIYNMVINDTTVNDSNKENLFQSYNKTKQLLDYRHKDNILSWSFRHAQKIIHDDCQACKNLVFENKFEWDTLSTNPYVYFQQRIRNISDVSVNIDFSNQLYTVSVSESENNLHWQLRSSHAEKLTIKAGEIKSIEGKLEWFATEELMPRIILPGFEGSIYTCRIPGLLINNPPLPGKFNATNVNAELQIQNILGIFYYRRHKIEEFIGSVGQSSDIDKLDVFYQSNLVVPHAADTRINFDLIDGKYSFFINFNFGPDVKSADKWLSNIFSMLLEEIPGLTFEKDSSDDSSHYNTWNIMDNNKITGEIVYSKFTKSNLYLVDLIIFSN